MSCRSSRASHLTRFLASLHAEAPSSAWRLHGTSIRAIGMRVGDFHADTLTFLANSRAGKVVFSPARFLDAAAYLGLPAELAMSIAHANDGRGEAYLREQLLFAVGLSTARN